MRLGYWFKRSLINFSIIIGATLMYTVMMSFSSPMNEADSSGFPIAAIYLALFGVIMGAVLNSTLYTLHLPLSLSFGSTRKEAVIGMQCYRISYALLLPLMIALLFFLFTPELVPLLIWVIPVLVGLLLFCGALGCGIGIVTVKYSKRVAAVCGILMSLALMALLFGTIFFLILSEETVEIPGYLSWLMFAVGIATHGIILIPEIKTVYHYNVKL